MRDRLRALQAASGTPLSDLVALFLDEGEQWMRELQAALASEEATTAAQIAHCLKGTSASYGAGELPYLCDRLVHMAAEGNVPLAAELAVHMAGEFERVAAALRHEFPNGER